jgi:hypothetical protein
MNSSRHEISNSLSFISGPITLGHNAYSFVRHWRTRELRSTMTPLAETDKMPDLHGT